MCVWLLNGRILTYLCKWGKVVRTNLITLPEGEIVDRSTATRNTKHSTGKWEPTGQESHNTKHLHTVTQVLRNWYSGKNQDQTEAQASPEESAEC